LPVLSYSIFLFTTIFLSLYDFSVFLNRFKATEYDSKTSETQMATAGEKHQQDCY